MTAPTSDISFGGYKATLLGTPTNPQDAATKAYVDGRRAPIFQSRCQIAADTVGSGQPMAVLQDGNWLSSSDDHLLQVR